VQFSTISPQSFGGGLAGIRRKLNLHLSCQVSYGFESNSGYQDRYALGPKTPSSHLWLGCNIRSSEAIRK
jgi:hypothetical protein